MMGWSWVGRAVTLGVLLIALPMQGWADPPAAAEPIAALTLRVRAYPDPGKVLASVDVPVFPGTVRDAHLHLIAQLRQGEHGKVVARATVDTAPQMREEISLDAAGLKAGTYTLVVEVRLATGVQRTSAEVVWPGRTTAFKGIKILNNFVWELLDRRAVSGRPLAGDFRVSTPCDRWLLVRSRGAEGHTGQVAVSLGSELLHKHGADSVSTLESMRFVKAGEHTIRVAAEGGGALEHLQVRAVPEIQHSRYPTSVMYVKQGVDYDWGFVKRHILPNVNTIISQGFPEKAEPMLREWKQRGGKWISYTSRPGSHGRAEREATGELIAEHFARQPGYAMSDLDGVLVDEFYRDKEPYAQFAAGVQALNARFPGKAFYPYGAGKFGADKASVPFLRACLDGGGYACWEAYLSEWDNLRSALNSMRRYPHAKIVPMEENLPGITRRTIWVFGAFSFPWPYADGYASVNFNAYLDMQFQFIATHPALFGLGGVHIWRTGYCDEERVRWFGRYFRHYCLEGATSRVSEDPYLLTHVRNPDFVDGTAEWTLEPARPDSITAGEAKQFGKFIGRYYRGPDTFLVTRRNATRPNVFSQPLRDLKPGRLYSLKMFTGDYGDLAEGRSRKKLHTVALKISGGAVLDGPRHQFQTPFPTRKEQKPFSEKQPFWLNYHWRVFRATESAGLLHVSDWKSPEQPGGPADQRLLYTFIEVKPYLGEE